MNFHKVTALSILNHNSHPLPAQSFEVKKLLCAVSYFYITLFLAPFTYSSTKFLKNMCFRFCFTWFLNTKVAFLFLLIIEIDIYFLFSVGNRNESCPWSRKFGIVNNTGINAYVKNIDIFYVNNIRDIYSYISIHFSNTNLRTSLFANSKRSNSTLLEPDRGRIFQKSCLLSSFAF